MITLETLVPTASASRYLIQLCKHFAHKIPTEHDEAHGRISFESGTCDLTAQEGNLLLRVTAADGPQAEALAGVVARHLERFAFRESLTFHWQPI